MLAEPFCDMLSSVVLRGFCDNREGFPSSLGGFVNISILTDSRNSKLSIYRGGQKRGGNRIIRSYEAHEASTHNMQVLVRCRIACAFE